MVGEALRQLRGGSAFSMRDVSIENALVIDTKTEVMTILRRSQLTTSQMSDWFDFSVSSYSGTSWIRNCWGQVCDGRPGSWPTAETLSLRGNLPTKVDSQRWYTRMSEVGLNYSGLFRSLEEIRSHPRSHEASGHVRDVVEDSEPRYPLHPSTTDSVLQLLTVAAAHGQPRLLKTLAMPTSIERIYLDRKGRGSQIHARVTAEPSSAGGLRGNGVAFVRDVEGGVPYVSLEIAGLKASRVDGGQVTDPDPHAAVQLEWKPVLDYIDPTPLVRTTNKYTQEIVQLEKLFVLCAADTLDRLLGVREVAHPHLSMFLDWLQQFIRQVRETGSRIFDHAEDLLSVTASERESQIRRLHDSLLCTEMRSYAIAVSRNRLAARDLFEGIAEPLEVLMRDNNLHQIYDFLCFWDYSDLLQLLGHNKPALRVLEVGSGTGGTTGTILSGLRSRYGERLYSKYSYTDISPGFFSAAQQRFHDNEAVEYRVLDISRDPIEQGFEEAGYDLVIAANVLHATPNLSETLANVRKLLDPHGGRLLLQELYPTSKCVNFIFGMLPGWWLGAENGRTVEPYISPERWHRELQAAGFKGADVTAYDNDFPFQINATIIASVDPPSTGEQPLTDGVAGAQKRITFIHDGGEITPVAYLYAKEFEANRFAVDWQTLEEGPPPEDQNIVVTLELERPFLDGISEHRFDQLITWVAALRPGQRVSWLTRCTQIGCGNDPRYALILGLARNIRAELSVAFATFELDEPQSLATCQAATRLLVDFMSREQTSGQVTDLDYEFVISNGVPYVGRFHWVSVNEELRKADSTTRTTNDPSTYDEIKTIRLEMGTSGLLKTLRYVARRIPDLQPNEVLIKVSATGMNFKDLLIAMGIIDTPALGPEDAASIGIETAGMVEAVGSAVVNFRRGDRIMAVSTHCFASHVVSKDVTCVAIPDELTFIDAATMPCVYATVIRALVDVGHIEQGQTVLIHSACGGVGIAAIQLCKMTGARVSAHFRSPSV